MAALFAVDLGSKTMREYTISDLAGQTLHFRLHEKDAEQMPAEAIMSFCTTHWFQPVDVCIETLTSHVCADLPHTCTGCSLDSPWMCRPTDKPSPGLASLVSSAKSFVNKSDRSNTQNQVYSEEGLMRQSQWLLQKIAETPSLPNTLIFDMQTMPRDSMIVIMKYAALLGYETYLVSNNTDGGAGFKFYLQQYLEGQHFDEGASAAMRKVARFWKDYLLKMYEGRYNLSAQSRIHAWYNLPRGSYLRCG